MRLARYRKSFLSVLLALALVLAGGTESGAITTATWDNGANASNQDKWGTSTQQKKNWSGNKAPSKAKDVAIFGGAGNSGIELVKDVKVGELRFDSTLGYSLTGSKKITFDGDAAAALNVTAANTGSHELGVNLTLNDHLTIDHQGSGTLTLSGAISGSKNITLVGTGTTVFASAGNSFTGSVSLLGGSLALGADNVLPDAISLSVTGGSLLLADYNDTINGLTLSGTGLITGSGTLHVSSFTYTGGISEVDVDVDFSNPTDAFVMDNSSADVLTIGKKLKHHGKTHIKKGKLKLKDANALPNSSFIEVDLGAVLDVSEAGFTLASGQTLGGSGTILGDLIVASGATLAPGSSPGTLSTGDQTWEGGGTLNIELDNATGVAGTNWDLLDISGLLSITATSGDPFQIALNTLLEGTNTPGDMSNFDASSTYIWTIVTTTGGITGFSQDAFSIDDSGFTNSLVGDFSIPAFSLLVRDNDLLLYYTPEPGTAVLLTMGLGSLGLRRRRTPVT